MRRCQHSLSKAVGRTLCSIIALLLLFGSTAVADERIPRVAVVTTVWYPNSHSDLIAGRLLEGMSLQGRDLPKLKMASLYVDQFPADDTGQQMAAKHGVPMFDSVPAALTLGGDKLAVDGVLVIAEHGQYPESDTGQFQFPKRRFLEQIFRVFESSGRVVPVFIDKHISDNWTDIAWIYGETQRLKIPLMAGSSLPVLWRRPAADVDSDARLKEIVATSYHRLDSYGFHAVEIVQCLAEHRHGGETGIKSVRCLSGAAVWEAGRNGLYDPKLLDEAVRRFVATPIPADQRIDEIVKEPILFVIEYRDGLRASILNMDGILSDWAAAWKYDDGRTSSTAFVVQDEPPFQHFALQLSGIEQMFHTNQPTWPAARTVLTSGTLDALLISRRDGGRIVETPHLDIPYQSNWRWHQPEPAGN